MECWENLLNTALLGTEKQKPNLKLYPESLQILAQKNALEQPENLLKFVALAAQYQSVGSKNVRQLPITWQHRYLTAHSEAVCSPQASQILLGIIADDNKFMLEYWLFNCKAKGQVVSQLAVAELLDYVANKVKLHPKVTPILGTVGRWLAQQNTQWELIHSTPPQDIWENGKYEEKLAFFQQLRQQNPQEARQLLEQSWNKENATHRLGYLTILENQLSNADEPFVREALKDKSQKVKQQAFAMLLKLPDSPEAQQLRQYFSTIVSLKDTKSDKRIEINYPETPAWLKFRDECLIGTKAPKDSLNATWLQQILPFLPLSAWEQHLGRTPNQLLNIVREKPKVHSEILEVFNQALDLQQDMQWVDAYISVGIPNEIPEKLWAFMPPNLQEKALLAILQQNTNNLYILRYMCNPQYNEWSETLVLEVFRWIADKNVYALEIRGLQEYIPYIPANVCAAIEQLPEPQADYPRQHWQKMLQTLQAGITEKTNIQKVFA